MSASSSNHSSPLLGRQSPPSVVVQIGHGSPSQAATPPPIPLTQLSNAAAVVTPEPVEEIFDNEFWGKVSQQFNSSNATDRTDPGNNSPGNDATDNSLGNDDTGNNTPGNKLSFAQCSWNVRLEALREMNDAENVKREDAGQDSLPLAWFLMRNVFDSFQKKVENDKSIKPDEKNPKVSGYLSELSSLVEIELKKEKGEDSVYFDQQTSTDSPQVDETILHYATRKNMIDICRHVLKYFPGIVYVSDSLKRHAIDIAITNDFDDVAAMIIRAMSSSSVLKLFCAQADEGADSKAAFKFVDIVSNPKMKETVVACLDACLEPKWYDDSFESKFMALAKDTSKLEFRQFVCHFGFLDGDHNGREPGEDGFVQRHVSAFHHLASSPDFDKACLHPVVRILTRIKWRGYAKALVRGLLLVHFLFLILMSVALCLGATSSTPSQYNSTKDHFRLTVEILVLLIVTMQLAAEGDQMIVDRWRYLWQPSNWCDIFGILGVFLLIPLRVTDVKHQWTVASLTYMLNVLRIFKFNTAARWFGLYAKILKELIYKDMVKFLLVYVILAWMFAGGLFLAVRTASPLDPKLGDYHQIILKEVLALVESAGFTDAYSHFNTYIILLIIVNMLFVGLILSNILIAQLTSRYDDAVEDAEVQFDIDRCRMAASLERLGPREKSFRLRKFVAYALPYREEMEEMRAEWDVVYQKYWKTKHPRITRKSALPLCCARPKTATA